MLAESRRYGRQAHSEEALAHQRRKAAAIKGGIDEVARWQA